MANVQQIIRDYLLRARSEGVAEVTAAASRLGVATDSLAVKTETQTRSQISAEKALERTALRMNVNYKTSNQLAQAEATLERARVQGLQGTSAYQAAVDGLAAAQQRGTSAANDNHSAFDRLGNMLTRRLIYAVLIREAKEAIVAVFNLNSELAKTGDIGRRIGTGGQAIQGLDFAATVKGVKDFPDAMLKFNDQVAKARLGLGDLGTLFRANGITVKDTEDAFLRVSELVKNAATESQKFSILQQAGLPPTREMARLMEQGAESIRRQAAEATKFTDDQLKRAQELDDKFNEVWAGFVRSAKKAFLEAADFPKAGSPLAEFISMVTGNKPWSIKLDIRAEPGSLLDQLQQKSLAQFGGITIPGLKDGGGKAANDNGARTTTNSSPTIDTALLKEQIALEQRRIGILGQMASVQAIVDAKQRELNQANTEGVGITRTQIAFLMQKLREDELGITALKQQADASRIENATIGLSIEQATKLRAMLTLEAQDRINGRKVTEEETAARLKSAEAAGAQAQALEKARIASEIRRERQTLFLSPENVQIAEKLKGLYPDIATALNSSEAAAIRLNNSLREINDGLSQIASAGLKAFAKREDPFKAMAESAKRLLESVIDISTKKLIGTALGSLFGDTASMSVGATSAASILTTAGTALAAEMIAGATTAAGILGVGGATAGVETAAGGLSAAGALAVGGATAGAEIAAGGVAAGTALAIGGTAAGAAINGPLAIAIAAIAAIVAAIGALTFFGGGDPDYVKNVREFQDQLKRVRDFDDRRVKAGLDANTLAGQKAAFEIDARKEWDAEFEKGGWKRNTAALIALEGAHAVERLKIETDFYKQSEERARQHQEDILKRQLSAQDRLFAATNDNSTLEGALAEQARRFARERYDEEFAGNEAKTDLIAAQLAEELQLRKSFSDKALDEAKRAAQEQLDAQTRAAKGILDYVNNLRVGPDSSLSPTAKLSAAQSTYNSILALAQTGNLDAQSRITQDAENFRKAAREVYASSAAYQNIEAQIISQLLALPAVTTSTDPVVQQLLAVQTAIQATTTAVTNDTTQTVPRLDISIGKFDTAISRLSDVINSLSSVVQQVAASNAILQPLYNLQDTAKQQLQLLNQQLSGSVSIVTSPPAGSGPGGTVTVGGDTIANNLLVGINKIVYNTRQAAEQLVVITSRQTTGGLYGTTPAFHGALATGGWITGGIPGRDSVRLGSGDLGMPGEFVVRRDIAQANASWLPAFNDNGRLPTNVVPFPVAPSFARGGGSDNSELIAEVRELRKEVAQLKAVVSGSAARGAQATVEAGEKIVEATDRQTDRLETVERQKLRARG